ncbi:hypothetical protein PanWU01x14_063070 [Parasponia andersonii]|uniref:Transmembrane protein n=1 Tax=Parasponia andersonii TaxID=3476 RepID=A0A2P5DHR3_PARAD|nr:hypothetical protein PanWU01x14_063070 [Parasponia andersonii]
MSDSLLVHQSLPPLPCSILDIELLLQMTAVLLVLLQLLQHLHILDLAFWFLWIFLVGLMLMLHLLHLFVHIFQCAKDLKLIQFQCTHHLLLHLQLFAVESDQIAD